MEEKDVENQNVYDAKKNRFKIQYDTISVILILLCVGACAGLLACLVFLK